MPNHTLLLVLVVVLVLEIPQKTEDEDQNDDEDETFQRIFHTGSKRRADVDNLGITAATNPGRSLLASRVCSSYSIRQITPMNKAIRFKLFLMMVLELLIWGAWLPLINGYMQFLEFDDWQRTWVNNAFAVASITAMFFSNQFADRNFA